MTAEFSVDDCVPRDGRMETPFGTLYEPVGQWVQVSALLGVFGGSIALGRLAGLALGDLGETESNLLFIPFVAVLFAGYALWSARLKALAFEMVGKGILGALWTLVVRRRKPENLQDLLPSKEKLLEMAVRAQKTSSSFRIAALPVAGIAGLVVLLFDATVGPVTRVLVVAGGCLAWGWFLARLARRGYLPVMEEGG